jgi:hypothetical protein
MQAPQQAAKLEISWLVAWYDFARRLQEAHRQCQSLEYVVYVD